MPDGPALKPPTGAVTTRADQYLHSTFFEQLVEHVFVSELLQEAYFRFGKRIEVLRSEIDADGYDIVFECDGIVRHVQLKTSSVHSRTAVQKVNVALSAKPSGCVIWLARERDEERCRIKLHYRFFGNAPGEPLDSLEDLRVARHTKANSKGIKLERPSIRVIPKGAFEQIDSAAELLDRLFGLAS